MFHTETIVLSF